MIANDVIPLSSLLTGEEGTILRLEGGAGFIGRLAALGFTPGVTIKVARNPGRGPIIVSLLDTQIALGRGQAAGVKVRRNNRHPR